ncbi:hypothetical protein [Diplocloster hominis]|uniref:hypothetical protein n=1 Tax=Diplocloster hominis TaxID=3079010 RepID=UPI0031BB5881
MSIVTKLAKPIKKKKRKRHKPSILHTEDGTCYLCMKLNQDFRRYQVLHEHHIFGGPNRAISEAEGMKVFLCLEHHISGPAAVHNNHENMLILQQDAQRLYEVTHTRQEFMKLIGRNYLDDEKELDQQQESAEPGFRYLDECDGYLKE